MVEKELGDATNDSSRGQGAVDSTLMASSDKIGSDKQTEDNTYDSLSPRYSLLYTATEKGCIVKV